MSIRIGIVGLMQESNSFAPQLAELPDFDIPHGSDLIDFFSGTNSEIAGFLDGCKAHGWTPVPLTFAGAISGGPLSRGCFEALCSQITAAIGAGQIDGLLLALHGALSAEQCVCGDAQIVRRIREKVGVKVPIVVSHDFHANVTPQLLTYVDGLSGYRTYPHIDQRETGRRCCDLLARRLASEPSRRWYLPVPLLLPPQSSSTFQPPLKAIMDRIEREFAESAGEHVSLFCVQPWLDFAPVASSVVVTQFGSDTSIAERMRDIAAHLWSIRGDFKVDWVDPGTLIQRIETSSVRPLLVSEAADSPTGGAAGDDTSLLRGLLPSAQRLRACIYLVDPVFAERAHLAGVGAQIEALIGAKIDTRHSQPVTIRARVERLSDGAFTAKGPAFNGRIFSMGATAVVRIHQLRIVVASKPVMMIDPELYRSQGIEPAQQDVVGVKSPLLFRPAYESISSAVLHLDTPGPCRGRLEKVGFKKINRPIYPLDDFEWTPEKPQRIDP